MFKILIRIVKWLMILILPFIALIRGAIYFHDKGYSPWFSIGGGAAMTIVLLVIYLTVIRGFISPTLGGAKAFKRRGAVAAFFIFGFCIHALFFISSSNLKNKNLSNEIRGLHPIVRLAVSTVIIFDKGLVITDATRKSSDYETMGLPTNERSLHFPQKDGYAYAIDLRTNSRSIGRNLLLQNYFRLMGFKTLKHTGTAPHLHISLKPARK